MEPLYAPRLRKSPKVSSVEEWWRMGQEGGAVEPTQVDVPEWLREWIGNPL